MADSATPTPDLTTDKPPRRRRWIPLSLRMFVVILGILGVVSILEGVRVYRQRVAVHEIEQVNGTALAFSRGPGWLRTCVGNKWMMLFDEVVEVDLGERKATDEMLRKISYMPSVEILLLENTPITDAGLSHLQGMKSLQGISLAGTPITDAGLSHLKGLFRLRQLRLDGTQVTARGVSELKQALPDLEILGVPGFSTR